MSKSVWSIAVTGFFTVVTAVTPIPDAYRHYIVFLAWLGLLLSCLGWLVNDLRERAWIQNRARHPMTLLIIGAVGAVIAIVIWLITEPKKTNVETDPFRVEVRSAFVSDSGPLTFYMVGYQSMFGQTISPVFYLSVFANN